MINIRHNKLMSKQRGFATLGITVVVLLSMTIISFFTANSIITEQKVTTSAYKSKQAFDAAQAGLDYGIAYLTKNSATVTDGMSLTGSLSNGSNYSLVYQFQGGTNELVKVISTATSSDGLASRVVEQLVKSVASTITSIPVIAKGEVIMANNSSITNFDAGKTIVMAGTDIAINQVAITVLASGTSSSAGSIGADIELNNTSLGTMTANDLAINFLGASVASFAAAATITATNGSNTNYDSLLDGVTGTTIYINQTGGIAELSSGSEVGTAADPVIIVVDGDLLLTGNTIIHGSLIVSGTVTMRNNSEVHGMVFSAADAGSEVVMEQFSKVIGAVISGNSFIIRQYATLTYDPAVLINVISNAGVYGKLPGSWKDVSP